MPRIVKNKSKKPALEIPQQEPIHILVIEDEEALWELIRHGFQRCKVPYRLTFAATLSKARDILAADPPTLIFLDWMLPDGKGEEILPEKKEDVEFPIVIMTCHGDEKLALKLIKKGAINYFVKDNVFFHQLPYITEVALKDWKVQQERKQVEEKLRGSEERYRALAESAHDAIYILNKDGIVEYVNNAGEAMLGMPAKKISGCTIDQLFQPQTAEEFHKNIKNVIATKKSIHHEILVPHPLTLTWLDVILTPLTTSGESETRVMGISRDITNQKKVEQALRDSEAQYRNVVENIPDLILVHDNGIIRYGNPALEKVIGYTSDEVINMSVMDFVVPQYRKKVLDAIQRRIEGKPVEPYEIEIITRSGEHRTVTVQGSRIDLGGSPAFLNVLTDVTEQKRASEALKERERKYHELFSSISDAVFVHDFSGKRAGRFVEFNDKACQMLGYTREELARLSPMDINNPGSGTDLKLVSEKLNRGEDVIFEQVLVTRENQHVPVEIHSHVFILGERRSVISLVHDITNRKRAEKELRFLAQVADNAPASITVHDFDGNFLYANEETFRLHGYTRGEFLAKNLHEIDVRESEQLITARMQKIQEKGEGNFDVQHFRKDGSIFPLHVNVKIMDWGGREALLSIATDLTARKAAEEALSKSETRYRELIELLPQTVFEIDSQGKILSVNPAGLKSFGYSKEDLENGVSAFQVFAPKDHQRLAENIKSILWGEALAALEYTALRKDGSTFPVITYSVPIIHEHIPVGLLGVLVDISGRKKAEEALRVVQEKYTKAFLSAPDAITISELESGKFVEVNDTAITIFGYSRDELVGKSALELGIWLNKKARDAFIDKIKTLGRVVQYEAVDRRKSGELFHASVTADTLTIGDSRYLVSIIRDITERKRIEEALKESEEKYRSVAEMAKDGIAIVQGTTLVYLNQSLASMAGYSVKELLGTSFVQFVAPESVADVLALVKNTLLGKPVSTFFPTRIRHRDGHIIEIEANGTMIVWQGKNALLGIIRDVTERNRTEEALRESEEKYRNLAETIHDFIVTTDFDGVITYANPAARQLVGGRDIVGLAMKEFMDQDQIRQHIGMLIARRQGLSEPLSYEWHLKSPKDGSSLLLDVRSSLLMDRGKPSGILFNARNITERKHMEDEIRTLNRTLEERVIERTKQLDASLQEKEILLREIHHRVKNNLQIVASLLNLQSRYIHDEEILAAINESQNRVKAMALVHEKLYQAKNISKINLNEFIRFLGNNLFQFYGVKSKGITFETEISDISVDINTAVPLGLIINELISNSLKYAFPDGRKGAIYVSVREENERYSILFRDNGIGITDDLEWRNTDSLGLRLVNSLVEQLDGTIELTKGKGTTFNISIHREKG